MGTCHAVAIGQDVGEQDVGEIKEGRPGYPVRSGPGTDYT